MNVIIQPKSKFLRIVCSKCKNEQTIFNKPASKVFCLVCGSEIAENFGGKAKIKAKVLKTFE